MADESTKRRLHWVGRSYEDLCALSEEVRSIFGFAIYEAETGGRHVDAKPLRGYGGAGVLEIVADDRAGTYRAVYTVKFPKAVYVLHVFQKKSKKGARTPKQEMDAINGALKAAGHHYKETYEKAQAR